MADVKISVSNGKISVDKNKVTIAAKSEQVTFKGDSQFAIQMPTGHSNPSISQQGGKWTGAVGPFPEGSGTLKYDVTAPGAETLDPEIQILP